MNRTLASFRFSGNDTGEEWSVRIVPSRHSALSEMIQVRGGFA